jgi:hypothetical protein
MEIVHIEAHHKEITVETAGVIEVVVVVVALGGSVQLGELLMVAMVVLEQLVQ